jgi:sugar phosphate isomerase/epimerase
MKKRFYGAFGLAALIWLATACNSNPSTQTAGTDSAATTKTDSTPGVTEDWKLGVQLWTFRMFTLTEALQKVDSCGIKYVEAFWGQALGGNTTDTFGIHMAQAGRDKLKDLLKSHNMQMVAMGVISPGTRQDWIDAFKLAKEFNLSYVTAEPKKNMWDLVDSLAGIYDIRVAIHDHPKPNVYWHPDSVLAAVNGHKHIGSCADIGHWARNGLNVVDCLKKLEGHIYGVHLKDIKVFDKTDAADTVVGKGVIKFTPIFEELRRQQFRGMLSIEHESNWYHSVPDVIETARFYKEEVGKLSIVAYLSFHRLLLETAAQAGIFNIITVYETIDGIFRFGTAVYNGPGRCYTSKSIYQQYGIAARQTNQHMGLGR